MIQFNLLPDVKKKYIEAKRTKRLIISASIAGSLIAIGVVILLYSFVQIGQKEHIEDLTADIQEQSSSIKNIEDIDRMLTVQSQLQLLPALHEKKPETSRLFDYLSQLVPVEVSIGTLSMDMTTNTLSMTGTADSLASVNKLVNTLKFTKYTVDEGTDKTPVFVITTTTLNGDNASATYQIETTFDPVIFDNTKDIKLVIDQPDETAEQSTEEGQ